MSCAEYDVIVVGGGASGVSAAVAASATGAKTLLLERCHAFGGEATNALVPAFCGFCTNGDHPQQVVRGVGEEFLRRLRACGHEGFHKSYSGNLVVRQDPETTKWILDGLVADSGADYLLGASLLGVHSQDGVISSVDYMDDEGIHNVIGRMYVDATGEGKLTDLAGGPLAFHHDQAGSLIFRMGNVRPGGDYSPKALHEAMLRAKDAGETVPAMYGYIDQRDETRDAYLILVSLEITGLDARTQTHCVQEGRRQARVLAGLLRKYMPGFEESILLTTGGRLAYRESRRIYGDAVVTDEDVASHAKHEDCSIARGGWSAEVHKPGSDVAYIEEKGHYFGISLGALHPRECKNLWVAGRLIAARPLAAASVRVMGTGFATGQAAGIAAGLGMADASEPARVQAEILRQGGLY